MTENTEETIRQLSSVIERTHGGRAFFIEAVPITEFFKGKKVWEGVVHIFRITGHLQADTCYAWSSSIEGSTKKRYYTVLHVPPIDSPEKAVRASIVQDHKTGYI
jgi:hypothetical protein